MQAEQPGGPKAAHNETGKGLLKFVLVQHAEWACWPYDCTCVYMHALTHIYRHKYAYMCADSGACMSYCTYCSASDRSERIKMNKEKNGRGKRINKSMNSLHSLQLSE